MESAGKRAQAYINKPVPRSGHVAVTYGDLLLVWGGYNELPEFESANRNDDQYLDGRELCCYNIEAQIWDVWHTRNSPPGMSGSCAACVGKHMYVFGGFSGTGNSNKLYRLDLKTKTWTHLNPEGIAPSPRDKATCWPYEDKLVFFGGFGPPPDNDVSSSILDQWQVDPSSIAYIDIFMRGWNNHVFVYSIKDNTWSHVKAQSHHQPCPRAAHAAAVIGNKGYLFGGRFEFTRMNDLHVLDLDTMEWCESIIPGNGEIPTGRSWHCMVPVSTRHLLVYGGYSTDNTPLSDVWVFDVETLTWHQQPNAHSETRLWHTGSRGVDVGEAVIFGGCCNDLLDPEERSVHSSKIFNFFFSPKSLSRLCSEAIVGDIDVLKDELSSLPSMLRRKIELRLHGHQKGGYNLRSRPQSS